MEYINQTNTCLIVILDNIIKMDESKQHNLQTINLIKEYVYIHDNSKPVIYWFASTEYGQFIKSNKFPILALHIATLKKDIEKKVIDIICKTNYLYNLILSSSTSFIGHILNTCNDKLIIFLKMYQNTIQYHEETTSIFINLDEIDYNVTKLKNIFYFNPYFTKNNIFYIYGSRNDDNIIPVLNKHNVDLIKINPLQMYNKMLYQVCNSSTLHNVIITSNIDFITALNQCNNMKNLKTFFSYKRNKLIELDYSLDDDTNIGLFIDLDNIIDIKMVETTNNINFLHSRIASIIDFHYTLIQNTKQNILLYWICNIVTKQFIEKHMLLNIQDVYVVGVNVNSADHFLINKVLAKNYSYNYILSGDKTLQRLATKLVTKNQTIHAININNSNIIYNYDHDIKGDDEKKSQDIEKLTKSYDLFKMRFKNM